MNKKKLIFSGVVLIIIVTIVISGCISFIFLISSPPQEQSEPIIFRNILVKDTYNSTFHFDVTFTTEAPEYLVKEKIHVYATLDKINDNSKLPLTGIDFSLVETESGQMPFQNGHMLGKSMEKSDTDYFLIGYDTYLNFSGRYSCRLIINYINTTSIETERDVNYIGPLLEVHPSSVGLQIKWTALQIDATNKTIALALLVFILTLITILIMWIEKYESLVKKWNNFFRRRK